MKRAMSHGGLLESVPNIADPEVQSSSSCFFFFFFFFFCVPQLYLWGSPLLG